MEIVTPDGESCGFVSFPDIARARMAGLLPLTISLLQKKAFSKRGSLRTRGWR
jgi:hypothetical protein